MSDQNEAHRTPLEKFVYNPVFESIILTLVAVSVSMFVLEKIVDFPVRYIYYIERADMVILAIFSFEFVLKLYLKKGAYFFGDYGWIDFLSLLPVLAPAIKALRGVKMLRGMRMVRTLRLLRVFRFLKFSKHTESVLKQKLFVPISTTTMLLVILVGMVLVVWQEGVYNRMDYSRFESIVRELQSEGPESVAGRHDDVIEIRQKGRMIFQRYSAEEQKNEFLQEHLVTVDPADYGISGQFSDGSMLVSRRNTYRLIQKTELYIILISLGIIIFLILLLNRIVDRIVLHPLAKLRDTMDKVVVEVPIPNSDESRKEINFDVKMDYHSNDEIGQLAEKYDILLRELELKITQSKHIFRDLVNTMMNIFGEFHNITQGHQIRTARIARRIGMEMKLNEKDLDNLYYGMMLHDLGKIGVNKDVLTKPGGFDERERLEMMRHPEIGYDIARDFPLISSDELRIIREHHEKYDGSGYPKGLKGDQVSPLSRIAAVADIFDALSCPRDYKKAKSPDEVKSIMEEMRGSHLDPEITEILWKLVENGKIIVNISVDIKEEEWIRFDRQFT